MTATVKDIIRPGGPFGSNDAEINQAANTTKAGLINSEGCNETNPKEYQRVAPLPKSVPSIGSMTKANRAKQKATVAQRRTVEGDIIEVMVIAIRAIAPKIACRCT